MTAAPPEGAMHADATHESGLLHVTGAARYVDDLPHPPGLLHAVVATAGEAPGELTSLDVSAAQAMPGVVRVLTVDDVPGDNCVGPIVHDEPVLADGTVHYHGQVLAVVVAETREQARAAAAQVIATIEPTPPIRTIDAAIEAASFHTRPHVIARGDVDRALQDAPLVVEHEVRTGAQDHFYLETQVAMVVPEEHDGLQVWSSTQHPTEIQRMVARVCDLSEAQVTCSVPRLGGGFGGKESQATQVAVLAALGCRATGRPVKLWLDRREDMGITGKRHPFQSRYRAGFDTDGRLLALDVQIWSDGGWSSDLSGPVMDRALFHLDNAYFVPAVRLEGRVCCTHLPSNTAFRGFGGPQGIVVVEDAMERAAHRLGLDPAVVRRASYYASGDREHTPYGQHVPEPRIGAMHDRLVDDADWHARRAAIEAFNTRSRWNKRGIGIMPVKFGISFTASLLNQAGALVLVYADGTVQLNHGGTEMGQGLHTKMRAVAADTLGVSVDAVRVMTTATDKVPNTSATAASSGSDLNGMAVREACAQVRDRMIPVAADLLDLGEGLQPTFRGGRVVAPDGRSVPFSDVARVCWVKQVSLSSTGFYRTPGIVYDPEAGRGRPFFYFAWGVGITEVEVCGLTGEHRVCRVDILHDVGDSLIPTIDIGQIEGAYVQGLGWLTGEQVLYGDDGRCLTVGPSTYKIPSVGDVPLQLNVQLLERATQVDTIGGSKAVGEPPFMLAIGVVAALRQAIGAFGEGEVELALPATPEAILRAVEQIKA